MTFFYITKFLVHNNCTFVHIAVCCHCENNSFKMQFDKEIGNYLKHYI